MPPYCLSFHQSVLESFCHVVRIDDVHAGEVGDRSRHLQHAVVAARGEAHACRRASEQLAPIGIRAADLCDRLTRAGRHWYAHPPDRAAAAASSARRERARARPLRIRLARLRRWQTTGSAGTSTMRSMRSRNGPESLPRYFAMCVGVQRHPRCSSPKNPHGQGFIAATRTNRAGNTTVRAARAIVTRPSSSG